jgi:uncharacterized protein (DUF433 family)
VQAPVGRPTCSGKVDGGSTVAYLKVVTPELKDRLYQAVWVSPQRMSGTPCFRGTRVPVQSVIDLLESGETIDEFLKVYPSISRGQVLAVLDFANNQLLEFASSLTSA